MRRLQPKLPLLAVLSLALLLSACAAGGRAAIENKAAPAAAIASPTLAMENETMTVPTATAKTTKAATEATTPITGAVKQSPTAPPAPTATLQPDFWKNLPVIPIVGEGARQTYQRGLALGNNPHAFSKIGDCGSTPAWFLGDFDRGPRYYNLGDYDELQEVIDHFSGSYERTSLAARSGFNASSIWSPIWSDRSQCGSDEAPLACEYRVQRPVMAFIMLGTNDVFHQESFEPQMRAIIEYSLENGVIPILSTKADNEEGDGSINATIARLALEYDVPLWNYWRAVQSLPNGGLQEDGVHITWGGNRFSDPQAMQNGWPVRNLTALQTLDAVWRYVSAEQP